MEISWMRQPATLRSYLHYGGAGCPHYVCGPGLAEDKQRVTRLENNYIAVAAIATYLDLILKYLGSDAPRMRDTRHAQYPPRWRLTWF